MSLLPVLLALFPVIFSRTDSHFVCSSIRSLLFVLELSIYRALRHKQFDFN